MCKCVNLARLVGSPAAAAHDGTMDSITAVLGAPLHDQGATKAGPAPR
jgi:hypothetical protein